MHMIRRALLLAFNFDADVQSDGAADGRFIGSLLCEERGGK